MKPGKSIRRAFHSVGNFAKKVYKDSGVQAKAVKAGQDIKQGAKDQLKRNSVARRIAGGIVNDVGTTVAEKAGIPGGARLSKALGGVVAGGTKGGNMRELKRAAKGSAMEAGGVSGLQNYGKKKNQ